MEQYVVDTFQSVFYADSLESTRPMNYGVQSPTQIKSIFDSIAYDKGKNYQTSKAKYYINLFTLFFSFNNH